LRDRKKSEEKRYRNKEGFKMANIPMSGLMRIKQVLEIVPVSRSCWWNGVKNRTFPQPIKLSKRVTAWRATDIAGIVTGPPEADLDAGKHLD
jgi:prophage regulatory protein